jgi:Na+/proline symporter
MNEQKVTSSGKWAVDLRDIVKGLVLAVIVPVITVILQSAESGSFKLDWQAIATTALSALSGYILYKLPQPAKEITKIK